ncbi:phage major capsid protein [Ovoidimarina sediminis]|uniref:phage major capsid protein n=1 Tax=Ovoidimarina sediminis TaxID=3079856 RepID=UPI00290BC90F|nr:phage major capsid protein [Rhodophyticola sp. MJ-SS7]MDU8945608.1 phage major capsid protein [Rhodophyticola sp. MJ-SS7]
MRLHVPRKCEGNEMSIPDIRKQQREIAARAYDKFNAITEDMPEREARNIEAEFDDLMEEHDRLGRKIRLHQLDDLTADMPRGANASCSGLGVGSSPHERAFSDWLRAPGSERAKQALMEHETRTASGLTGAAGGYVVPEVIDTNIQTRARDSNPFRGLVRTVRTRTRDVKFPLSEADATQGWVGELGTRSQTTEPTLASKTPTFGMNYAYVYMSEELAMNAIVDIENWFVDEVSRALGEAEADAIVSGNGTNKPTGFLNVAPESGDDGSRTADAFKYLPSGTAATLGTDASAVQDLLADLVYDLHSGYRANGRWLMNSATAGTLRKYKDADNRMLWSDGLAAGEPSRLLGYPVSICESMPDIGADAHPIGFGDWYRAYVLCLNNGLFVQNADRSITTPGTHKIYVHQSIGGATYDENAVRFAKCATT